MKKGKEGKQNKRNGSNFFKYVQPQQMSLSQQSKVHSRSLMELQQNTSRYQQSARVPSSRDIHNSSLYAPPQTVEAETIKSHSLKKFLSIFGPANLNPNSYSRGGEDKQSSKGSGRQLFTCNIKNMNVNVTNSKDREHKQGNTLLVLKRGKNENNRHILNQDKIQDQAISLQLRKFINEGKEREDRLKIEIDHLQKENHTLKVQIQSKAQQFQLLEQKCAQKQSDLLKKIDYLQKLRVSKEKCREHELIIESLKKVINEQLKKIIQLQKLKIQREEIQKLEERINLNINITNEYSAREKLRLIETNQMLKINRKEGRTIKIEQQCFIESAVTSPNHETELFSETIEEATEQEERDSQLRTDKEEGEGDSILEEVDKYLAQWRSKS